MIEFIMYDDTTYCNPVQEACNSAAQISGGLDCSASNALSTAIYTQKRTRRNNKN